MQLNVIWYVLFVVIIAGYVVLDGFDMGVGILHLLVAKNGKITFAGSAPYGLTGGDIELVAGNPNTTRDTSSASSAATVAQSAPKLLPRNEPPCLRSA